MGRLIVTFILLCGFVLVHARSSSADPDLGAFGFEFTATAEDGDLRAAMAANPQPIGLWERFRDEYRAHCRIAECTVVPNGNRGFRLEFRSGFWIGFDPDPGVMEITFPKMPLAELAAKTEFLESHIFEVLEENLGLVPHPSLGGGHVSVDIGSHFGTNFEGLLDFIEDSILHQDMFRHASRRPTNAVYPLTGTAYEKAREQLSRARSALRNASREERIEVIRRMGIEFQQFMDEKGTAIALHIGGNPSTWRIEFRTAKPQRSVAEALRFAELLVARKEYLRAHPPLPGLPPLEEFVIIRDPADIEAAFHRYVSDTGADSLRYVSILREDVALLLRKRHCPELLRPK